MDLLRCISNARLQPKDWNWYPAACLNQVNLPCCSIDGSSSILPPTLARWPCCTATLLAAHLHQVDLLRCDVAALSGQARLRADTVVMNPPFGTRQKGADIDFLRAAFRVPPRLTPPPLVGP